MMEKHAAAEMLTKEVSVLAQNIAAKVQQRANRMNPTEGYFTVAVPIIAGGILDGRAATVERAAKTIQEQALRIRVLEKQVERQVAQLAKLTQPGSEGIATHE